MHCDFGFNHRLDESTDTTRRSGCQTNHSSVVHVSPYGLVNAITHPHLSIRKTDLAADRNGTVAKPSTMDQICNRTSRRDIEGAKSGRDRRNVLGFVLRDLQMPRDRLEIEAASSTFAHSISAPNPFRNPRSCRAL